MTDEKKEPVEVFICGPDRCPKGGEHEWGDELQPVPGWLNAESIMCKKCGADKMSSDMWEGP